MKIPILSTDSTEIVIEFPNNLQEYICPNTGTCPINTFRISSDEIAGSLFADLIETTTFRELGSGENDNMSILSPKATFKTLRVTAFIAILLSPTSKMPVRKI